MKLNRIEFKFDERSLNKLENMTDILPSGGYTEVFIKHPQTGKVERVLIPKVKYCCAICKRPIVES